MRSYLPDTMGAAHILAIVPKGVAHARTPNRSDDSVNKWTAGSKGSVHVCAAPSDSPAQFLPRHPPTHTWALLMHKLVKGHSSHPFQGGQTCSGASQLPGASKMELQTSSFWHIGGCHPSKFS